MASSFWERKWKCESECHIFDSATNSAEKSQKFSPKYFISIFVPRNTFLACLCRLLVSIWNITAVSLPFDTPHMCYPDSKKCLAPLFSYLSLLTPCWHLFWNIVSKSQLTPTLSTRLCLCQFFTILSLPQNSNKMSCIRFWKIPFWAPFKAYSNQ